MLSCRKEAQTKSPPDRSSYLKQHGQTLGRNVFLSKAKKFIKKE